MSYILDALRRSQAERERGRVPGLDAQPAPPAAPVRPPAAAIVSWVAAGVVLALGVGAVVGWLQSPGSPAPAPPGPAPAAAAQPPSPSPSPSPTPSPGAVRPLVVSAPPPPAAAQTAAAPPAVVVPPASPAASAAATGPALRPIALAALTPEQRRELPPLALGGSVWSDNPGSRFVIVNGQLVHEGEAAAPGVIVERIDPRAVVLRWHELHLELPL